MKHCYNQVTRFVLHQPVSGPIHFNYVVSNEVDSAPNVSCEALLEANQASNDDRLAFQLNVSTSS